MAAAAFDSANPPSLNVNRAGHACRPRHIEPHSAAQGACTKSQCQCMRRLLVMQASAPPLMQSSAKMRNQLHEPQQRKFSGSSAPRHMPAVWHWWQWRPGGGLRCSCRDEQALRPSSQSGAACAGAAAQSGVRQAWGVKLTCVWCCSLNAKASHRLQASDRLHRDDGPCTTSFEAPMLSSCYQIRAVAGIGLV